jgi:hypothetical protein
VGLVFIDGGEVRINQLRGADALSQSEIFRQSAPHPRPPASNVIADAGFVRTLLIKPGHPFDAPMHGLLGDTGEKPRSGT